jgi:PhnB protein
MTNVAKPIPEGYHTITPYLIVDGAASAIAFYKRAFSAVELHRLDGPGGKVAHAEIKIGDSPIMLADEALEMGLRSAKAIGGSPISVMLYVEDVDALSAQATAAGATVVRPVTDHFYGDRSGTFEDPYGIQWHISTHTEDVSPEELEKRMAAVAPA